MLEPRRQSSIEKWERIIDGLVKLTRATSEEGRLLIQSDIPKMVEPCGFCEEYEECYHCPLGEDDTCWSIRTSAKGEVSVFWKCVNAYRHGQYSLALKFACTMLERIETAECD